MRRENPHITPIEQRANKENPDITPIVQRASNENLQCAKRVQREIRFKRESGQRKAAAFSLMYYSLFLFNSMLQYAQEN